MLNFLYSFGAPQLANAACSLSDPLGMDSNSWVLTSDNEIKTSSHTEYKLSEPVQEGDVIVSL